jgi:hypothetical protein
MHRVIVSIYVVIFVVIKLGTKKKLSTMGVSQEVSDEGNAADN